MHPSELETEKLLAECEVIRQRRSGPGGQHRNKVETAIRLQHLSTGVTAQASERRSQAENLHEALQRLRTELALTVRSKNVSETSDGTPREKQPASARWQRRTVKGKLQVNPQHEDFAPLLAELLDQLQAHDWNHQQTAEWMKISASQLIKFLNVEPRALMLLNTERQARGLSPLTGARR